jgi:hypothetical protein
VFSGTNLRRSPLRSIQRQYDPKFFHFYSSHSQKQEYGANAVEENIDSRGNVLKGAFFKLVLVAVVVLCFAVYHVWGFFHPEPKQSKKPKQELIESVSGTPANSKLQQKTISLDKTRPNMFLPKTYISKLSNDYPPLLSYYFKDGNRVRAYVVWRTADNKTIRYSDDALRAMGWHLFFTSSGSHAILSDGQDFFVLSGGLK